VHRTTRLVELSYLPTARLFVGSIARFSILTFDVTRWTLKKLLIVLTGAGGAVQFIALIFTINDSVTFTLLVNTARQWSCDCYTRLTFELFARAVFALQFETLFWSETSAKVKRVRNENFDISIGNAFGEQAAGQWDAN
jgi:hypothetical protein